MLEEVLDCRSSCERFAFGKNWAQFLRRVSETHITESENALKQMLQTDSLAGMTFLDVGSGSGLSSLAARRLGARVHSFDYDAHSVECTQELRRRFQPNDTDWSVEQGSVLDADYMISLGTFDVVYSWGVLHHTGEMWQAMENVIAPVAASGRLHIAIYNDQGEASRRWLKVKQRYNRLPRILRRAYVVGVMAPFEISFAWQPSLMTRPRSYYHSWLRYLRRCRGYTTHRGMSYWHDLVDWVGGLPFEVASPEEICNFYKSRGFELQYEKLTNGLGNNQFVFSRTGQRKDSGPN